MTLKAALAHDVLRFAILVAIAVFTIDWVTKSWALETVQHEALTIGALVLGVERNDGFAFSSGAGRVPRGVVLAVRLAALVGLVLLSRGIGGRSRRLGAGFAMLLAGGLGNVADVAFRGGKVVDFIHAGPFRFEVAGEVVHAGFVFNTADVSIVLALALLAPAIREWSLGGQKRLARWETRWRGHPAHDRADNRAPTDPDE